MRTRTPDGDRGRAEIQCTRRDNVREDAPMYDPLGKRDSTSNAQRPTLNAQSACKARSDLEERLFDFSVRVIRLVDARPNTRAANHIAGQLLRRGTSPYGNHGEVDAAESRKDFVHKLKVWLRLIAKSSMLPETKMHPILNETEELIKIFFSSIRTAERNAK